MYIHMSHVSPPPPTHTHYTHSFHTLYTPFPFHTQEIDQTVLDADEIPNDDLGKNPSELYSNKHTHDATKACPL